MLHEHYWVSLCCFYFPNCKSESLKGTSTKTKTAENCLFVEIWSVYNIFVDVLVTGCRFKSDFSGFEKASNKNNN